MWTVPGYPVRWLGPMKELSNQQQAIELLQQLGFKEYEAKCFVALSRLPKGSAKEISETSDVPRTRVYDAIRVLETRGLVEVQHSSPQQFRAVPISEAVALLRQEYESRAEDRADVLQNLEPVLPDGDPEITHEVWSLSGSAIIANRTEELVDAADREILLIVGRKSVFTEGLVAQLQAAQEAGVDVAVGAVTDELRAEIGDYLPGTRVFTSGLEWLRSALSDPDDGTEITRLLLIDRNTILVSSTSETTPTDGVTEKAVFGRGFSNGIVVIARRMMATGLEIGHDPGKAE